jgi:hypothetical protein
MTNELQLNRYFKLGCLASVLPIFKDLWLTLRCMRLVVCMMMKRTQTYCVFDSVYAEGIVTKCTKYLPSDNVVLFDFGGKFFSDHRRTL